MSLKPQGVGPIPEATVRVAHAAFPKGNAIMRLRDALGPIYTDEQFRILFPHDGLLDHYYGYGDDLSGPKRSCIP